ncbi:transcription factor bHLH106-like [Hordeum vulgare subsp. vulgare]|uniref:BHLH domain-containing protein n=1 Tax=Hordeum vulgare subsp. vulgare TaxID=112509 RepID=A0A8I6XQ64_HORVV|nr:transcription factor bHLH106-like [Hordeum vulgare subsp. vulgare]
MATDGECSTPAAPRKGATGRSHSEAERKRRQRINAHLATLRTLVPSASRMDKAALLGEVVRHVRELQGRANDATEGVAGVVPGETDEVGVEEEGDYLLNAAPTHDDDDDDARWRRRVRAWVCCADRPGLMSDLGRAVRSVGSARPVRAEIATVGGRTRSVLELDHVCHGAEPASDRAVALSTLRAALRTVLLNREELLAAAAAADGYKRPRLSPVQQLS